MKVRSLRVSQLARGAAFLVGMAGCAAGQPSSATLPRDADARSPRFVLKHDSEVMVRQPPPHGGVGESTAYRYFDELRDANLIFRKRALHQGASIGVHSLEHDEVYYVLSGGGELEVDGSRYEVVSGTAVFMYRGARVGIRQLGDSELVLIIAYPPAPAK